MANHFPAILSCASMSPATALSGSAQWKAWRAGEMANSLGTRTLLAWSFLRFLRIATQRFGSAATRWRRLESSARLMEQMFTAMDRTALSVTEQTACMKIVTTCSGWWGVTEFGDGGPALPRSITCHLERPQYRTWVRPAMELF